jgi:hypothetical protein
MIIQISDRWRVKAEGMNFVLQELRIVKPHEKNNFEGGEAWAFCGYYPSLKRALQALPDHLALSHAITTYEGFLEEWESLIDQFAGECNDP